MPVRTPVTEDSQELQKVRKSRRQRRDTTSTISTTTHLGGAAPRMSEHQCCGVVEEAAFQAREKRVNRTKPQPWIARKLMVGICLGIMGYTAYVYIGRFCIGAIKQTPESATGRPAAIVLLVFFCILFLWMIWAYIKVLLIQYTKDDTLTFLKVILTSPGFARDHIPQTPQPLVESPDPQRREADLERTLSPYEPPFDNSTSPPEFDPTQTHRYNKPSYSSTSSHMNRPYPPDPIAGPSYEDIVLRSSSHGRRSLERGQPVEGTVGAPMDSDEDGGVGQGRLRTPFDPPFSTLVPQQRSPRQETVPEGGRQDGRSVRSGYRNEIEPSGEEVPDRSAQVAHPPVPPTKETPSKPWNARSPWRLVLLPGLLCHADPNPGPQRNEELRVRRRPSTTPILQPGYRYCYRDGLVKPYRTHHCRNCGTCVLKFDHHCPWIGQCVGARNHKFFMNFCQAAGVFTIYVLATLVGFNVRAWVSQSSDTPIDPQVIVVSALAALFALFTNGLASSHMLLIMKGQTTVESMIIHSTKERESAALRREYGVFAWRAVREARRRWNEEWGDLDTEGNIWWTGSKKQAWIDVMGTNPLGWILPIGRSLSDGLSYPVNPRFDEHGRLRRRADWPAELR